MTVCRTSLRAASGYATCRIPRSWRRANIRSAEVDAGGARTRSGRIVGRELLIKLLAVVAAVPLAACAPGAVVPEPIDKGPLVFPPPPDAPRFVFERTIRSSADVERNDRASRWRQVLTGETRSASGFAKPFDVTVCQGRIFVSDTVRRSVMVFDVPGERFFEIGTEDPGLLRKPLGLANDSECNLYVLDGTLRRLLVYDQDGRFLRQIGERDDFNMPSHVAVDPEGLRAYCVDTGGVGSDEHRVRVFDLTDGTLIRDIGKRGTGPGDLNLPRDAAIGPDNRLYVVDGGNFRVQVFELDGNFQSTFGSIGRSYGQFSRPKGIAIDGGGNVYVSDAAFGNFQIFDSEGRLLMFVGSRSESPAPARYMLPAGIAVDHDGRVYLVDQFFRKVDVFRPAELDENEGFLGARQTRAE